MKEPLSQDAAAAEVSKWLDNKGILPTTREIVKEAIDGLIELVQYGICTIDLTSNKITQILKNPIRDDKGDPFVSELVFNPRLTLSEFESINNERNAIAQTKKIIAILTGKSELIIGKMDTSDYIKSTKFTTLFLS